MSNDIQNLALDLVSRPPLWPQGTSRLDYYESFIFGTRPCDIMLAIFSGNADNVILDIHQRQPTIFRSGEYRNFSTLVTEDLFQMNMNTIGRTFNTAYCLSDKFHDMNVIYLQAQDTSTLFIIMRIERSDGKIFIVPTTRNIYGTHSVNSDTIATLIRYLQNESRSQICCFLSFVDFEIPVGQFGNLISVQINPYGDTRNNRDYVIFSSSFTRSCYIEENISKITMYYRSSKQDVYPPAVMNIEGEIHPLKIITSEEAYSHMHYFYGLSDIKIN